MKSQKCRFLRLSRATSGIGGGLVIEYLWLADRLSVDEAWKGKNQPYSGLPIAVIWNDQRKFETIKLEMFYVPVKIVDSTNVS